MGFLQRSAERLSRHVVLKRRLPAAFGGEEIVVSPDSTLAFWKFDLERAFPEIFRWAQAYVTSGSTVWDIGANVGLFAFASAGLAGVNGHVVAVEPDSFLQSLLRRTRKQLNSESNARVSLLPAAIGTDVDLLELNIANRGRSLNFVGTTCDDSERRGVRETVETLTISLDWMLERLEPPDVVRIDVAGAEYDVLLGGRKLFSRYKPSVLCAVNTTNSSKVTSLLHEHGYQLFDLQSQPGEPIERACHHTLAVPIRARHESGAQKVA